jgi:hypothetical protein
LPFELTAITFWPKLSSNLPVPTVPEVHHGARRIVIQRRAFDGLLGHELQPVRVPPSTPIVKNHRDGWLSQQGRQLEAERLARPRGADNEYGLAGECREHDWKLTFSESLEPEQS